MVRFLNSPVLYFSEAIVKDRVSGGSCLHEREIEDLVRGTSSAAAERRCRAHLLWCLPCQNRVEEEAEFAQATRSAAVLLQEQEAEAATPSKAEAGAFQRVMDQLRKWFSPRFPMRWAAVAVSAGVLITMAGLLPLQQSSVAGEVVLRSERGSALPVALDSAASANVRLRIDVSDVVPYPAFNLAVVDANGRTVETTTTSAKAGSVRVALHRKLTPGRYWVRLSAPDGRLLREYALSARP
jgi:methionine-rich copper-binding protein CopC